jgi:phosphoribosylaminoimidazole-succinocarboxamide synthase
LRKHERLPEPLLTPTTKAAHGSHDELASRAELIARRLITGDEFDAAAELARRLFEEGSRFAETRGLILVDTKYELGFDANGVLTVVDEIHTPDSSRYWYRDRYAAAMSQGRDPEALDKEYLRRWLVDAGYRGKGPLPEIPLDVRCEAARRYIEAFEQVTGRGFEPNTEPPLLRIRRNLGLAAVSAG